MAATGKIYLSGEFLAKNVGNVTAVAGVLLEEFGHFVDSQINSVDAIGDEGEIFADLVQGKALSQRELAQLKGEDDSAIVVLDGVVRAIEQRVQSDTLDFFANQIDLGSLPGFEYQFIKPEPFGTREQKIDNLFFKADVGASAKAEGSIFAKAGSFGNVGFSYPVNVNLDIPSSVKPGETIFLKPSLSGTSGDFKDTKGLASPDAGLKLGFEVEAAKIKNIEIKNPFGAPIKFSGFELGSTGKAELTYNASQFLGDPIPLPFDVGEISASLPQIEALEPAPPKDTGGELPNIAASGKSENIINLQVDLDKALSIPFPALKGLGNEIKIPEDEKARYSINLGYDLLDVKVDVGFGLQQNVAFDPDKILVTISAEGQPDQQGILGDPNSKWEIKVPTNGCGLLKVKAKYELKGDVKNDIGGIFQGSINAKAIEVRGSANFKGINFNEQLGPLASLQIPSGGFSSEPFPLLGTDSNAKAINPFYVNLEPKNLSAIGGQEDTTKNLIVETEYEIPYNLPISVSNASVTEGNSGTKDMVFPVTLRDPAKEAVTLSYNSPKGSGTVTIAAGQTRGEIKIPVIGDIIPESDETFTLTVKDRDGKFAADCPVTDIEATGSIIDDDQKPEPPKDGGKTYNDPRIVTVDKQYHDFQAAGEFTLIESTTGDLKIQVRQQPIDNNPRSNVSDNTALATILAGKRIGIYKDLGLLIDGQKLQIATNDALAIGDGRIYREGSKYTIVYPTGDQLVATVGSRVNVEVFLTEERQGKVKGLLGNFNNNSKDDLAKPDGTVIPEPVSQQQLYGEYADSWRINQAASLFDYKPGENTSTFTLKNYPRQKVKIEDLNPADIQKAEQLIGDRIKNPITREAAIIDLILTNFDPDIIQAAIDAPDPESTLEFASVLTANNDFSTTTVNTATTIDVLANDIIAKDPLSIKEFNTKSLAGGIITLDNNNTPDDKTDDKLTYTPPPNFTGTDKFNYLLTDGKQIQAATVNVNINSLKLDNLSGNNGFVLNSTEAGNFSGVAVSKTGDINGDKIDDIIVGSFGADPNNINAAGKSQVIFGTQKFPASVNLSQLNGQNGFTLNGTDAEGFSGGTVSSAGDINGDGIKDFIIGAFGAAVNGQNNAGKTYIVFGTNKGFPANFNLANLNGNNGFAVTGTNTFDYAGLFATGISDINGDRIDDILISAPGPLGGTPGKSYVIYGRTTGFSPNLNLAEINNNNGFVINGIDGNSSGTASSGDINGDGIPDLVIGADGGNTNGGINAGKTYVIFGQQGGFTGSVNVPELNGTTGFVITGLSAEERSGIALTATGDINGDGNKDLVIGAPGATVGDRINAGKTYVVFGKKEAFPVIVNPAELNGSNGFIISGFDPEGSAGNALSYAGDINKDGFDDLLIGASSANSDDKNNAGKTFVVFGSKEFPANFSLAEANGKNALVLNGVETDGLVGTAVSGGGDINGDGIDDLIVGAPGSLFQDSPGKTYAVFGSRGFGFANPNNGLQGTVQDNILNGTDGDDSISGRQGNDKIFGNSGQDVLSGNLNDDYLDGEKGQDIVIGGDGKDSLFGGLGNDVLKGDNGNDILTGVDINAINPGIEEIDTLTGGGRSDIFVLGDANNTYYDNGDSDYALITDFNASEDSIQLQGKAADYVLVPFSQANQVATAIYRKAAQNELIGILQGGANLSLSGGYFRFI